ncbi:MAG: hypothetical protein ACI4GB_04295 [Acutalibacteraceae bacterium]
MQNNKTVTNMVAQNFDNDNINNVRAHLNSEKNQGIGMHKIFTLVQDNSACKVIIKKSSREKCVKSLLK